METAIFIIRSVLANMSSFVTFLLKCRDFMFLQDILFLISISKECSTFSSVDYLISPKHSLKILWKLIISVEI